MANGEGVRLIEFESTGWNEILLTFFAGVRSLVPLQMVRAREAHVAHFARIRPIAGVDAIMFD